MSKYAYPLTVEEAPFLDPVQVLDKELAAEGHPVMLTSTEACDISRMSLAALLRAIQRGDLEATKRGGGRTWLIRRKELARWLTAKRV